MTPPSGANGTDGQDSPSWEAYKRWLEHRPAGPVATTLLGLYLAAQMVAGVWVLVWVFPDALPPVNIPSAGSTTTGEISIAPSPSERRLTVEAAQIVLALAAGLLGSFMHSAQSFAVFVGNRQLRASWIWWYVLRGLIGAVLGALFCFVVRAGLMASTTESVSPYGIAALAALAGWFSKQATDKLAEVFDTLFRTERPAEYKDKLTDAPDAPRITGVEPSPIPAITAGAGEFSLRLRGGEFHEGVSVSIGATRLESVRVLSEDLVEAVVPDHVRRRYAGTVQKVVVATPAPHETRSAPAEVRFE